MAALTAGIRGPATLSSSSPRPTSTGRAAGTSASSPQRPTHLPRAVGVVDDRLEQPEERRVGPRVERGDRALSRSAARKYWVRSLLPMLKKSTSSHSASIRNATDGTSTMTPTRRQLRPTLQLGGDLGDHRPDGRTSSTQQIIGTRIADVAGRRGARGWPATAPGSAGRSRRRTGRPGSRGTGWPRPAGSGRGPACRRRRRAVRMMTGRPAATTARRVDVRSARPRSGPTARSMKIISVRNSPIALGPGLAIAPGDLLGRGDVDRDLDRPAVGRACRAGRGSSPAGRGRRSPCGCSMAVVPADRSAAGSGTTTPRSASTTTARPGPERPAGVGDADHGRDGHRPGEDNRVRRRARRGPGPARGGARGRGRGTAPASGGRRRRPTRRTATTASTAASPSCPSRTWSTCPQTSCTSSGPLPEVRAGRRRRASRRSAGRRRGPPGRRSARRRSRPRPARPGRRRRTMAAWAARTSDSCGFVAARALASVASRTAGDRVGERRRSLAGPGLAVGQVRRERHPADDHGRADADAGADRRAAVGTGPARPPPATAGPDPPPSTGDGRGGLGSSHPGRSSRTNAASAPAPPARPARRPQRQASPCRTSRATIDRTLLALAEAAVRPLTSAAVGEAVGDGPQDWPAGRARPAREGKAWRRRLGGGCAVGARLGRESGNGGRGQRRGQTIFSKMPLGS